MRSRAWSAPVRGCLWRRRLARLTSGLHHQPFVGARFARGSTGRASRPRFPPLETSGLFLLREFDPFRLARGSFLLEELRKAEWVTDGGERKASGKTKSLVRFGTSCLGSRLKVPEGFGGSSFEVLLSFFPPARLGRGGGAWPRSCADFVLLGPEP